MNMKPLTVLHTGLTYNKVIRDIDRREMRSGTVEQNWKNYIELARSLLAVAEVSRMGVAEIATRATILKTGGDRHSLNWKTVQSKLTVKAFANSIGVKPATLWLWIKIKTKVFDQLSDADRKKFKHEAGEKAFKRLGSKVPVDSETTKEIYRSLANRTKAQRAADRAIKHIMSVRKVFRNHFELMDVERIGAVRIALLEILKIIEERR